MKSTTEQFKITLRKGKEKDNLEPKIKYLDASNLTLDKQLKFPKFPSKEPTQIFN